MGEKGQMAHVLYKDGNNCLKDAQKTKGRCGESQENNVQTKWK